MANAVSIRIKGAKSSLGQAQHDLRIGQIPSYVDSNCLDENVVLFNAKMNDALIKKEITEHLKEIPSSKSKTGFQQQTWQKKSNLVINGIISFGRDFDRNINKEKLDVSAMKLISEFCSLHKIKPLRTVRHEDEYQTHYHFSTINQNFETGRAVSGKINKGQLGELQDLAFICFKDLGFERGIKKEIRMKKAIEDLDLDPKDKSLYNNRQIQIRANVIHKGVKELHFGLPKELLFLKEKIKENEILIEKQIKQSREIEKTAKELFKNLENTRKELSENKNTLKQFNISYKSSGLTEIVDIKKRDGTFEPTEVIKLDKAKVFNAEISEKTNLLNERNSDLFKRHKKLLSSEQNLKNSFDLFNRERQLTEEKFNEEVQRRNEEMIKQEKYTQEKLNEKLLNAGIEPREKDLSIAKKGLSLR